MGWKIWSSIHDRGKGFSHLQNDQINPGVHLPPTEEKLRTFPRGYSGRVKKLTTHLHLLEEYLL